VQEVLAKLTGGENDDDYLTNPDAEPDRERIAAMARSGMDSTLRTSA